MPFKNKIYVLWSEYAIAKRTARCIRKYPLMWLCNPFATGKKYTGSCWEMYCTCSGELKNIAAQCLWSFFLTNPFYVQGTSMHNQQHTKRWAYAVSTFFYRSYKNNNEGDDIWLSIVRASNCQCQSHNCPGFDLSILRYSVIWVLN